MPTKPTGRPRGRPKGSKNIPNTLEALVAQSLASPPPLPPSGVKGRGKNPWGSLSPEEQSARGKAMRAARHPSTYHQAGRKRGVPSAYTAAQWEAHQAAQRPVIDRVLQRLAGDGKLPEDPRAVEVLGVVLLTLRSRVPAKDRIAAARLLLDFTKHKPTTRVDHAVRTAEDILDEMAAEDDTLPK